MSEKNVFYNENRDDISVNADVYPKNNDALAQRLVEAKKNNPDISDSELEEIVNAFHGRGGK